MICIYMSLGKVHFCINFMVYPLAQNYQRHLITPASTDEGQEEVGHDGTFAVPAPPVPGKRGRKRKKPLNEEQFQEFEPQLKVSTAGTVCWWLSPVLMCMLFVFTCRVQM